MKCPTDNSELQMTERQGVEIDYCPTCRGVWLDRGELDKIIDRASDDTPSKKLSDEQPTTYQNQPPQYYGKHVGKHGRKSIMRELFDF